MDKARTLEQHVKLVIWSCSVFHLRDITKPWPLSNHVFGLPRLDYFKPVSASFYKRKLALRNIKSKAGSNVAVDNWLHQCGCTTLFNPVDGSISPSKFQAGLGVVPCDNYRWHWRRQEALQQWNPNIWLIYRHIKVGIKTTCGKM